MIGQSIRQSGRLNSLHFQIILGCSFGLLLGITSLWFSPLPLVVMGGLVGIILFIVLFKRPELGVIGIIIIASTVFSFSNFPRIGIGIGSIYISDLLIFAFLAMILTHLFISGGKKFIYSSLSLPLLLFVGIALCATIFGILLSDLTLKEALGPLRTIINYLYFFVALYLCQKKHQLKFIANGLILAATLVAVLMVIQFKLGPSHPLLAGRIEILGTEGLTDPDATRIIPPGYPLITVSFILLTASFLLGGLRRIHIGKFLQMILIGIGVLITYKRHIWGTIVLSVLIMLFMINWQKRVKLFFQSTVLIVLFLTISLAFTMNNPKSKAAILMNSVFNRVGSLFQSNTYKENSSLRWRDFEYEYAAPQIIKHPLLGLGLGAKYRPFVPYRDNKSFDGRGFIHNGHISLMVKTGLLGYACYLWFAVAFLYRGFKNWRSVPDPLLKNIVIGSTLSFLGLFLGSMLEPMLVEWGATALIGILIGSSEAILLYHGRQQTVEAKKFINS